MRKKVIVWIGIGIAVIVGLFLFGRFFGVPAISPMPDNLGWNDGFATCPEFQSNVTNCVSSTADADSKFYVAPIAFTGSVGAVQHQLLQIINSIERSTVITNDTNSNYIHAEFRSQVWGFIDDTEFYIDEANNLIHVRAAARLGQGDLGVNRNRVERIRQQFGS